MNAACSLASFHLLLPRSFTYCPTESTEYTEIPPTVAPPFDDEDKKAFVQVETSSLMLRLHPFSCEPVPR